MVSVTDHRLKFFKCFALTHNGRHFLEPADVPTVVFPILQRELLHDVDLSSAARWRKAVRDWSGYAVRTNFIRLHLLNPR